MTAHQERLNFVKEFLGRIAEPSMAPVFLRGLLADPEMTEVEFVRYRALMHSWFLGMAEIFWLQDQGVLDSDRFAGSMAALRSYLSYPGCRAVWQVVGPLMPTSFRAQVDRIIAEGEEASPHDAFDLWRSAAAVAGKVQGG